MKLPSVCVMMSVYNGEKFLEEQINSIFSQQDVRIHLVIRDDGSTDSTRNIISCYPDIVMYCGRNLGAAQSFLEIAALAPKGYDFYSFSDADDVWMPDKLSSAISLLKGETEPAVVLSRLKIVDENLKPTGLSYRPSSFSFDNALVQCVFGGAGATMNAAMFARFVSKRPLKVVMHDSWLYLIACAFGKIIYQEEPHVLYRQHQSNVFGAGDAQSATQVWSRRLKSLLSSDNQFRVQAVEFLRLHGADLSADKRSTADRFAQHNSSVAKRLAFAISPRVQFISWKSRTLYCLRAALGKT